VWPGPALSTQCWWPAGLVSPLGIRKDRCLWQSQASVVSCHCSAPYQLCDLGQASALSDLPFFSCMLG
jgi:hypothetical protein